MILICDNCKNKYICKHYEYFKAIPLNITLSVSACELYEQNKKTIEMPEAPKVQYKQPIDYGLIDEVYKDPNVIPLDKKDEEVVIVNLEDYNNAPKSTSIIDIVMKGDDKNGNKEKN